MEFYMVVWYNYDGYGSSSSENIIPFLTSEEAMDFLEGYGKNQETYHHWEIDEAGFKILIQREGKYAYNYYGLERMMMGEVIV